jgi:hypothetical protein
MRRSGVTAHDHAPPVEALLTYPALTPHDFLRAPELSPSYALFPAITVAPLTGLTIRAFRRVH